MQITFYVLNNTQTSSSSDELEAVFLLFVCQLTQTVLAKSDKKLIILDDDQSRLQTLDRQLWSFSDTAFIPHDLCLNQEATIELTAPVILTNRLPNGFDGVVINLASQPVDLPSLTLPSHQQTNDCVYPHRLLEIIAIDAVNKQKGRDKYRAYRDLGYEINLHQLSRP